MIRSHTATTAEKPRVWTAVVLAVSAPVVALLCFTLWRTPFPVTEAIAILEDVAIQPATRFLTMDTSYYRPLFHMTISAIWHNAGSLETRLAWIRLLHIVPIVVLVTSLVLHLRPRTRIDAAAAVIAVAVLIGSPGFRDNLELPLSYTIVGMPMALIAWIALNRERRWWHPPVLVLLTLMAVGFKEQGLVLVPLVVAAWWMRAPGVGGRTTAALAVMAGIYGVWRLIGRASQGLPMFEQAVGLGFGEMDPPEAFARFGGFPYFIYAYSGASTISNVLFSEPTRGTFSIIRTVVDSRPEPWQLVHLGSSAALTALIGWWGVAITKATRRDGWSLEARSGVALAVALVASGILSFNYSRDRLGGMAVPFYAIAAYYGIRFAAARVRTAPRMRAAIVAGALVVTAIGWPIRLAGTVEWARLTSARNQMEWLVQLPARRLEFAGRPAYLRIMDSMIEQGTDPAAPWPARYPRVVQRFLADLPPPPRPLAADSFADALAAGDVRQAFEFIRAGQDPNELILVSHADLTGGQRVLTSPLLWAAANGKLQVVQMLLGYGARMERAGDRRAPCVAEALGAGEIARLLRGQQRERAADPCDGFDATPPLLR
jgi:hypothetical protein